MLSKFLEIYSPEELESIQKSFEGPKNICVFINKIKYSVEEFCSDFAALGPQKMDDFCYLFKAEHRAKLSHSRAFGEGKIYLQNYASYLCAKNLGACKNQSVLDLCAAPGGKSINLANFMQNEGYLACVEAHKTRFFTLQKNLKNYGVRARIFLKDARSIGALCPLKFDKILLDAPCSTLAKIGICTQKSQKEIRRLSTLQKGLLNSALKALKQGGELIYSTCTFTREENEGVLENALGGNVGFELLELDVSGVATKDAQSEKYPQLCRAKRILPCLDYDGFFIAKLRRI
ncbi:RsmB/NOP family class I SAM-dependent RNA methyltransferase [Campylobacter sp.]|uniref:RsmB/NOP family class I SAM-dependent RNA methyltransferase n=1 Tax=Campylobacter sp. TaxID=205 RepID=UPI0026DB1068|nr:RsmB/NOP family class I SAM-dependent RNA methyltransferase [Campylobacter sp.]MDO4674774.1 RsmB/NOP family class I SAM-dependent RNA methyltransferase [Campylobacter sp.]